MQLLHINNWRYIMKILKSLLAVCIGLLICDTHASKKHTGSYKSESKKRTGSYRPESKKHTGSYKTEKVKNKEHGSGRHKSYQSRVNEEDSQEAENVYQKEHRSRHHKPHEEGVNKENFQSDRSGLFGAYKQALEEKAVEQTESTDIDYTE